VNAIIKTLPVRFARGQLERFLGVGCYPCFSTYYFTLGRGRPAKANLVGYSTVVRLDGWIGIDQLWFSHKGIVIGHFEIELIVQNVGQLPRLTTLDGKRSEWQIKPDRWVAVCVPPFHKLEEKIYHEGFRGWHYFDLDAYRSSLNAKVAI
jgi:hypothetical protein